MNHQQNRKVTDPKIIVLTNKGELSNQQAFFISELHKSYGVNCIFRVEQKKSTLPRHKRYLRLIKKHGCFKGLLVIANIPLAKIILNQIFEKRLLLLQKKIEKDVINDIPKVDGGILNSKESVKILNDIQPDIILQCGAGIIKPKTFQTATIGMINLHHGIIPSIRGMLSVMWAIREDKPEWIGISLHMIDEGIDTGALIGQARCSIEANDDVATLYYKLDLLGAILLKDGLKFLFDGSTPTLAPAGITSVYRSSFTVFDTIIYLIRKRYFFRKVAIRSKKYIIGDYLIQ